jgi:hypothetical protein
MHLYQWPEPINSLAMELIDQRTDEEPIDMKTAELTDMRTEEENKLPENFFSCLIN